MNTTAEQFIATNKANLQALEGFATQAFSGFVVTTGTRSFPWHLFACAEMATINRARVFVVAIDVLRTQTTSQYATVLNALASVTETKARSIDLGAFLRRWRRLLR